MAAENSQEFFMNLYVLGNALFLESLKLKQKIYQYQTRYGAKQDIREMRKEKSHKTEIKARETTPESNQMSKRSNFEIPEKSVEFFKEEIQR